MARLRSGVLDIREVHSTRTDQSRQITFFVIFFRNKDARINSSFDVTRIRRVKKPFKLLHVLKNKDESFSL